MFEKKYLFICSIVLLGIVAFMYRSSGGGYERIHFKSKNMYDFSLPEEQEQEIDVYGDLILPKECSQNNPCPLMIASHGSLSWRPHHNRYFDRLLDEGIGVFKIHPFGSRGIEHTVGRQTQVTHQMMISDAYGGFKALKNDERIDTDKVGFMGTSLGGGAALYSAWNPELLKKIFDTDLEFKVNVAIYPPCFIYPDENKWTNNTLIIMVGTADQWTPAKPCTKLMGMIYSGHGYEKVNKKLYMYYNEHHSYDDTNPLRLVKDAYDFSNCTFNMDKDGKTVYRHEDGEIHLSNAEERFKTFKMCAKKGDHYVGYNSKVINEHTINDYMIEVLAVLKPENLDHILI